MSSNRLRRIAKEIEETASDTFSKVYLHQAVGADDLTHLEGQFQGPPDTPYEGGTYLIDIRIPNDYPFRPPLMKFLTKIWHPNVSSQTGAICLDTLSTNWSPVFTIKSALISVQSLLASPEPKDPQDAEVAAMLLRHPKEFERVAREWAVRHAGAPKGEDTATTSDPTTVQATSDSTASNDSTLDRNQYHGYHPNMIDRFTVMGFDSERIVAAFEHVGVDVNDGQDYVLDEETMDDITESLTEQA